MYWQKRQSSKEARKLKQVFVGSVLLIIFVVSMIVEYRLGETGIRYEFIRWINSGLSILLVGYASMVAFISD
ncbi:hypothetical protein KJ671_03770 [Patescibacteria group bacterium]|nr:hypothetical protein [Patescibacteria group bacterium]